MHTCNKLLPTLKKWTYGDKVFGDSSSIPCSSQHWKSIKKKNVSLECWMTSLPEIYLQTRIFSKIIAFMFVTGSNSWFSFLVGNILSCRFLALVYELASWCDILAGNMVTREGRGHGGGQTLGAVINYGWWPHESIWLVDAGQEIMLRAILV